MAQCPPGQVCPIRTKAYSVASSYSPRWQNYDGLSRMEHARQYHGINTTGMTVDQVNRLMDQDHDRYGGGHVTIRQNRLRQPSQTIIQPQPQVRVDVQYRSKQLNTLPIRRAKVDYRIVDSCPI